MDAVSAIYYRTCSKCGESRRLEQFPSNTSSVDGLDSNCYICYSNRSKVWAKRNRSRHNAKNREWSKKNRPVRASKEARRRFAKRQAIPAWADMIKIREFYENCPKGYHVDHVIPLVSERVCGLHCEQNIQYLPAADNASKGNRRFG